MKRGRRWQVLLALILGLLSAGFYLLHFAIFRDAGQIMHSLIIEVAFLFIDVLIVTLVLHRLLVYREKYTRQRKINMVIGAFFSEVGTELLRRTTALDAEAAALGPALRVRADWTERRFREARRAAGGHVCRIGASPDDLVALKLFFGERRAFLLGLLGSPNLLEHESFTELLWAVFHLADELAHRADPGRISGTDRSHLENDLRRVHLLLVGQWLDYLQHLRHEYAHLFSLAVRLNPFDPDASVEVC